MNNSSKTVDGLKIEYYDNIELLILDRSRKRNALTPEMIIEIPNILAEADRNESVEFLVITGEGEYFTSGNDLTNFMKDDDRTIDTVEKKLEYGKNMFHRFVKAFIDFNKPLVAIVNGPTVGIGVTLLAHFDYVFASDMATFHCPFTHLGQTPEGCSTLLFPIIMGHSKAAEILIFGQKITAQQAYERNLVTEVVPHNELKNVWNKIKKFASLPPKTLVNGKGVMKNWTKEQLHEVNDAECDLLLKQWQSEEFLQAIFSFMSKKSSKL